jgi:U4/U6 small nuclear ribonucleoprotein PRP3
VGAGDEEERIVLPMYLTKDERKKLKRKRKHEKLLEKNDKIKLGLIEPDKPKLRVGNMAIVMKNEFVVDPSKIEA